MSKREREVPEAEISRDLAQRFGQFPFSLELANVSYKGFNPVEHPPARQHRGGRPKSRNARSALPSELSFIRFSSRGRSAMYRAESKMPAQPSAIKYIHTLVTAALPVSRRSGQEVWLARCLPRSPR